MFSVKVFIFSPIQENTYVLYNEGRDCLIIDPGTYFPEEKKELADFISTNGLRPKGLLNTHCHLDHVFGNKWIASDYGLVPQIHPKEKQVLEYAPVSGLMWGLPFDNYDGPLEFIQEGGTIRLGDDLLKILFVPGHSPGHVCFYCEAQSFVIAGDTLFMGSIGRTDLPGGDYDTLIGNIKSQLLTLPDSVIVYSGHGEQTTIGTEKKTNPFLK